MKPRPAALSVLLLGLLLLPSGSSSQEPAAEEVAEADTVRFLPVGEQPPFRQEVRDGVRHELEAPVGSIPPREITVASGTMKPNPLRLSLGRPSAAASVPRGEGAIRLLDESGAPWTTVKRTGEGDLFVLLSRAPGAPTWKEPRALLIPSDTVHFPTGKLCLVNFSMVTVAVIFGTEKIALPAGKTVLRDLPAGSETVFQLANGNGKEGLKRFHAGTLQQAAGERTLAVIHAADGKAPRQALRVLVHREPAL
ncbi:hypothetical protein OKA05_08830 [Luteolibacter arcticus]|uniref:Uncharacterized protein n=1 Tax=Luteolibacter arcticus TaxID=1581411 RepID=A0ABT3GGC1_9BACT|nr:hypothetical protein [Luteolibacter arcticus]MCW1922657.1 hypothetical protein [Luteolibacter arcticus]